MKRLLNSVSHPRPIRFFTGLQPSGELDELEPLMRVPGHHQDRRPPVLWVPCLPVHLKQVLACPPEEKSGRGVAPRGDYRPSLDIFIDDESEPVFDS